MAYIVEKWESGWVRVARVTDKWRLISIIRKLRRHGYDMETTINIWSEEWIEEQKRLAKEKHAPKRKPPVEIQREMF